MQALQVLEKHFKYQVFPQTTRTHNKNFANIKIDPV